MASAAEVNPEPYASNEKDVERRGSVAKSEKGRWERLWPVIACGAGLFSDGYLNNVRTQEATATHPARHTFPTKKHYLAQDATPIADTAFRLSAL